MTVKLSDSPGVGSVKSTLLGAAGSENSLCSQHWQAASLSGKSLSMNSFQFEDVNRYAIATVVLMLARQTQYRRRFTHVPGQLSAEPDHGLCMPAQRTQ